MTLRQASIVLGPLLDHWWMPHIDVRRLYHPSSRVVKWLWYPDFFSRKRPETTSSRISSHRRVCWRKEDLLHSPLRQDQAATRERGRVAGSLKDPRRDRLKPRLLREKLVANSDAKIKQRRDGRFHGLTNKDPGPRLRVIA